MRLFASAVLCLVVPVLCAQDTRGSISGTISDSHGAVASGAAVLIANLDAGTNTRLVSNRTGYYEAALLLPGNYSISAELPGFKKSVRTGVTLALSEKLQIDLQLEVGGVTESVTVSAEAPLLDTSTVSTGRALTNREVMDLPVIGNNISMLTRMAPGVQSPGTTQFLVQGQVGGGSDYRMPGGVGGNEWSLDGASTDGTDRRVSYMPSPDVIDEFKIEASNFDASFSHSTGLSISMSTKSGVNALHGSATEQYFNSRWNALAFFTKQARYQQIAAARASGNTTLANDLESRPAVPPGHTHQFAGTVSGPIYIPKILNGRNRLFFFLGYSGLRNLQSARSSEINYTVPTVAMRTGDYSKLLQINPNPTRYVVYDPLSVRVDPARAGHWIRTPFTNNIVPSNRFNNPLYDFYAKRMPLPNNDPTDPSKEPLNNFNASSMPNNAFNDSFNNRVDYQITQKHRIFARWVRSNYLEDAQDYTFGTEPGLMAWNEKRNTRSAALDWTYAMNSSTILNASVDANQFSLQNQRLGTRKYKPSSVGLPAYMDAKCGASCVLPRVVWPGMTAWSGDMVLGVTVDPGPTGRQQSAKFNVTHIRSGHSFHAGIDFRQHYRTLLQNGGLTSGNFSFANNFVRKDDDGNTAAASIGLDWAAFQLGMPTGMSTETNDTYALMNPYYAWYGQDTWRVTRKLTLTFGLRMEYELGPTDRYDRALSYFDPNLSLPISAAAQAAYARNPLPELPASQFIVKGGSVYTGRNGVSRRFWRNELMWLPRFSAAWQLNQKTVFRGGYGTYFDTLNVLNTSPDQTGFSRTTNTQLTNDAGVNWLAGSPQNGISPLVDPFPVRADGTRFDTPLQSSLGAMARVGQGFGYTDFNRSHPRVQRWRAGVQRELGHTMVIEVSYWGQWADRIGIAQKLDYLPGQYWATGNVRNNALATALNANVTNPFYIGNFDSIKGSDPVLYQQMSTLSQFTSTTIAKNRLLRAFPHMNGLTNNTDPSGKARTHALEVNFNRRFSKGFQVNASYTRMMQEDLTTIENEFESTPRFWLPTNNARPHRFTATGIFELPFGKGRRFLQHGILNHVLGGWQLAATYEFQPGPLLGWGNLFYYGNVATFGADAANVNKSLDQWFNTGLSYEKNSANTPAAFHVRVFPRVFYELRADGLNQWNANLVRNFRIREGLKLQLRGDAINLQNRSQFAGPDVSPTSSTFGKVQAQTSSLNRFYQIQARITF